MTNDELERAFEVLLKNQAAFEARQAAFEENFAAGRAAFRESQEAFREWYAAFRAEQDVTTRQIRELGARTDQRIHALSERQDRTRLQLDHLSNVVASIAEVTRRNSEEIDVLVKLVGGIIERGNGKSEG